MSACSACWFSLMKTAQVVCRDQTLASPSRTPDATHDPVQPLGEIDELDPVRGVDDDRFGVDDEAAGRDGAVLRRRLASGYGGGLTHREQDGYSPSTMTASSSFYACYTARYN